MKKLLFYLLVFIAYLPISAQTIEDKELLSLVDVVKLLRVPSEANYVKAQQALTKDLKWTPMDETGTVREQECLPVDKVPGFKLNRILSQVDCGRKFVTTHGDMVNGADKRYDYSLYERKMKAGRTVEYKLKGREGKQTFVLVPFNSKAIFEMKVVTDKGQVIKAQKTSDGMLILNWNQSLPAVEQTFTLSITNKDSSNQSFVIINHNTRKK